MNWKHFYMIVLYMANQVFSSLVRFDFIPKTIFRRIFNCFSLELPSAKQIVFVWGVRVIGLNLAVIELIFLWWRWCRWNNVKNFWVPKVRRSPPSCLLSASLGRHRYAQLKNIKLHYVESGDHKKPLMLCLHGFPEFWYSWKNQLRTFSQTHWVVAVDMRGYGDSDKPRSSETYQLNILIEDVRQLILKLGKETCVLMGHDFGALIGWLFAAIHPNMLTHYIALSCPHPAALRYYTTNFPTLKQLYQTRHVFLFQIPWIPDLMLQTRDNQILDEIATAGFPHEQDPTQEIEAFKYYFSKQGAWRGPLNHYREMFSYQSCLWMSEAQLRVRIPTLLIFGKNDSVFDSKLKHQCSKHVDHLECYTIDRASHWVHREEPEQFHKLLAKFLNVIV